ncbi:MAG TPA: hypothetical protein VGF48_00055 [Thermoanaerobaculia bacterium]|jgi:hypothetical protein
MRSFVVVYGVAALAWLVLREATLRLRYVLLIAIALRALLFVPEPRLSGDVYRYLWDGKVLAYGVNPYRYAPDDERLSHLREPWHARINHPELRTIYPPHAQLLFALVHQLWSWRLLLIGADLVAIVLLRRHGLAYATFPLLLFEGTWSGHVDALAAALMTVAHCGVALGIAGGLKVIPLATVPALIARSRSRVRFVIALALTLALPLLLFAGGPLMPGMRDYATRWIFNSPAYALVHAIVERIPLATIWTHHPLRFEAISNLVYRHLHADLVTRCVLATLAMAAVLLARRVSSALGWFLLLTPTVHPWYWLVVVPPALVERSRWIFVALCAPFSYWLYEGAPPLAIYALCYLTPILLSACASSAAAARPRRFRSRTAGDASPS